MSDASKVPGGAAAAFTTSEAERPRASNVLGAAITLIAGADRTGGLELFHQKGRAGQGPPPHAHDWSETFYILSGEVELTVDEVSRKLGPGAVAHVPGGVKHSFRHLTDGEMISVTSAPGASQLFAAIDAANPSGPPDMEAVAAAIVTNGARLFR